MMPVWEGPIVPLWGFISTGMLLAILKAAFGLGFVIFVHELGHFLVAKAFGVKCEKFYVGFDAPIKIGPIQLPRALWRRQWGETEYGIGIIPLGGYVKMLGQDDNPANATKEAERIQVESGDVSTEGDLDPRSYPAKPVYARLAIISAGVIMNLIFAVIFGMVAYRMGVSYTPTIVGSATPGLSAWSVGLQTGDRILQIGRDGKRSRHLRFDKDMMVKVMMTGPEQPLDLLVEPYHTPAMTPPEPKWVTVRLSSPQEELKGRPAIGISPYAEKRVVYDDTLAKVFAHLAVADAKPQLKTGDQIVAVNGEPVHDYAQLSRRMAQLVDQPLMLTIERPNGTDQGPSTAESAAAASPSTRDVTTLTVTVPVQPMRALGVAMQIGPVAAVQAGSPADRAGVRVGDRIVAVDGQPVGDPMLLPHRLRRLALAGENASVTIQLERDGHQGPLTLELPLRAPAMLHLGIGPNKPVAVESLGLAYLVTGTVSQVTPNSPAAEAGLRPGDALESVEFLPQGDEAEEIERKLFGRNMLVVIDATHQSWPHVHYRLQRSLPTTNVRLTWQRAGRQESCLLSSVESPSWQVADRGLKLAVYEEVHHAESWSEAWHLGVRETWESVEQVYFTLVQLFTGKLSPTNLGGPASIATMAGWEASRSTARLLIFLTLLSANLAVLNFLPIPVLDGGHAMFLIYEAIFRRPVNERVAFGLTILGLALILGLMVFVIGLDVLRLTGLGG